MELLVVSVLIIRALHLGSTFRAPGFLKPHIIPNLRSAAKSLARMVPPRRPARGHREDPAASERH